MQAALQLPAGSPATMSRQRCATIRLRKETINQQEVGLAACHETPSLPAHPTQRLKGPTSFSVRRRDTRWGHSRMAANCWLVGREEKKTCAALYCGMDARLKSRTSWRTAASLGEMK